MNSEKYRNYIISDEWTRKTENIFKLRGRKCEKCGDTKMLQIHHGSYARLYNERDSDLFILCDSCHRKFHEKYGMKNTLISTRFYLKGLEVPDRLSIENRRKKYF